MIDVLKLLSIFSDSILPDLFRNSVCAVIVFLIILGLVHLIGKRSIYLRTILWSLVLIRLLLPADLATPLSLGQLSGLFFNSESDIIQTEASAKRTIDQDFEPLYESLFENTNAYSPWMNRIIENRLFCIWLTGVALISLLTCIRQWKYRLIIQQSYPILIQRYSNKVERWKNEFNIHRSIRLVTSDCSASSFTFGIFRPVIYLPSSYLESLHPVQIEAVIAHEMAHIRLFDALWIQLQSLLQIVYFFHPIVWITNHRIHFLRECMCDALVLSRGLISGNVYGSSLLSSIKLNLFGQRGFYPPPAFSLSKKQVHQRIKKLQEVETMTLKKLIGIGITVILIGLLIVPSAAVEHPKLPVSQNSNTTEAINFIPPLNVYEVTSKFGMRKHPISGKLTMHNGIDLKAPSGTEVYAVQEGIIVKTDTLENKTGAGRHILIRHSDGFTTLYTQLNKVCVIENQSVTQGEFIGRVGSSGFSTGPHLHFEIRENGEAVNPEDYIQFQ